MNQNFEEENGVETQRLHDADETRVYLAVDDNPENGRRCNTPPQMGGQRLGVAETGVADSGLPTVVPMANSSCQRGGHARTLEIIAATDCRDRQGDVVEAAGLDFENYRHNPVVLWAHYHQRPPVGRVNEIHVQNGCVHACVEFADTPFAREVYALYAGGYLNAWSLGFLPRRWERFPASQGGGCHVLEAEVVEISAVPVPANPEALTKALERMSSGAAAAGKSAELMPGGVGLLRAARAVAGVLGRLAGEAVGKACMQAP